jgi:sugar phosphate isomerase/epimerase
VLEFAIPVNIDESIPLIESFRNVKESGFRYLAVTVNPQPCDYNAHTGRLQLLAYAREQALEFDSLQVPATQDYDLTIKNSDARMGAVCNVANTMHAARVLGVRSVILSVTHALPTPYGSDTQSLIRSLEGLIETAEIMRINLAMRNLIDRRSLDTLTAALREYNSPYFGLCYDSALDILADHEPYVILDEFGGRLKAVSFADTDGKIERQLVPFSGVVNWQQVCAMLTDHGYRFPVTFNAARAAAGKNVLAELAEARDRINQMLVS